MSYCPNCGKEITEGAAFCPSCGTKQNVQQPVRRNTASRGHLHCPSCRSRNLAPVIESSSTIGSVGRISKKIALTETKVNNKSFWMCQECGHKFRNLEDMIEENRKLYALTSFIIKIFIGIIAAFTILINLLFKNWGMMIFILAVLAGAYYGMQEILVKREKVKRDAEERKLRKACFD